MSTVGLSSGGLAFGSSSIRGVSVAQSDLASRVARPIAPPTPGHIRQLERWANRLLNNPIFQLSDAFYRRLGTALVGRPWEPSATRARALLERVEREFPQRREYQVLLERWRRSYLCTACGAQQEGPSTGSLVSS
jgi:hypothetical protein